MKFSIGLRVEAHGVLVESLVEGNSEVEWEAALSGAADLFINARAAIPYRPEQTGKLAAAIEGILVRVGVGFGLDPPAWQPWARWYPGFSWSFTDALPQLQVERGGVTFSAPLTTKESR